MPYVDGFVAAVPTANRQVYQRHAETAAAVFREHGALKVVECWGDDVPEGKITSFPMAVQRRDDETVVFSWIVWSSRAVHDEGMTKVMSDPRLSPDTNPMPFDGLHADEEARPRRPRAGLCGVRCRPPQRGAAPSPACGRGSG